MPTATADRKLTAKDFQVPFPNDWCPGCGDFGILNAIQQAFAKLELEAHKVAVVGGIGCSGKAPYFFPTYGVHTLHGRLLPFAHGIKLANPEMTVVGVGGDGDGLGIGAGHFVNSGRRNLDMTYILFNNEVYGLTKGQAAPTLAMGLQPKSLPEPNIQGQLNSLMMAMSVGFTWIGRGYSYNVKKVVDLVVEAIRHPGLSFLDILQPCPTYNNLHTKDWYAGKDLNSGQPRIYWLDDTDYDPVIPPDADEATALGKMNEFLSKVHEWGDEIPAGVFLDNRATSTFADRIETRIENYRAQPPNKRVIADGSGKPTADLSKIFDEVRMT
ncbi:MAG: thiamine pyrophosphate-dependent enzyme [Acidobacteriota bacterium]|jgi:2-oxoglutarate ferredoxin oxidoreductase subunit beta|nr:thiamine pyrophosphate-dependent enzyme [Acidobacteriota bacterium]